MRVWWGRVTPRAAQPPPQAAGRHSLAPGPTGTCQECKGYGVVPTPPGEVGMETCPGCETELRYKRALEWISGYWLGPTAVCQVHVDHMKGIARRALGEPYV